MEESTGYLKAILDHIFTGTSSDPVIAVLLFVCFILGSLVWFLGKLIHRREKQHQQIQEDSRKALEQANEKLEEVSDQFVKYVQHASDKYQEGSQETLKSYQSVAVMLTEIKTLLNTIIIFQQHK